MRKITGSVVRFVVAVDLLIGSMARAGDLTGACCACGGCSIITAEQCDQVGGVYQGDGIACPPACTDLVHFPDPALRAAVRAALDGCRLTAANVRTLTQLAAEDLGITSLTGLEHAVNLRSLALGDNRIIDVAPLAGLYGLLTVDLGGNQIRDLTPLRGLSRLTHLDLRANAIDDVFALSGLSSLDRLDLAENRLVDLAPLRGLGGLTRLNLSVNRITDAAPLLALKELAMLSIVDNCLDVESHCVILPRIVSGNPGLTLLADPANCACFADLHDDGVVGINDLIWVLQSWGMCRKRGDANWDGTVDFEDVVAVVSAWGPCRR